MTSQQTLSGASPPFRRLWQVPTLLLGVLAVLGVWLARPLWRTAEARGIDPDLATFRQQFEDGRIDPAQLVVLGSELLERADVQRAGEVHYLLGSALVRAAEQTTTDAPATWQRARTHLEQAETLGVPAADQPRLRYRLAKVWLNTAAGEKPRIVEYLHQSLGFGVDDRVEAFGLLTQAHLRAPPDVPAALEANAKQQLAQRSTDERILAPARLLRGELLAQLRQFDKAADVLVLVNGDAPPLVRQKARLLLAQCYQETEAWERAAEVLERILAESDPAPTEPGRLAYELGMCHRRLPGNLEKAEQAWKRALQHGGPHAQAAALRLADLAVHERGGAGALALLQQALSNVSRPEEYANPLVPGKEMVLLLERAAVRAQESGAFADAQQLARLLARVAPAAQADTLLGAVTAAWALAVHPKDAELARRLFDEAGQAYERAALAPEGAVGQLLTSGEYYRQARAFAAQARVLEQFLRSTAAPQERLAEAWLQLGEARETLGATEAARAAYGECQQRGGPHQHVARLRLALLDAAAGNLELAINQLTLNAALLGQESEDTRDRRVFEKTLILLGDLLLQQGQPERCKEALSYYTRALASLGKVPAAWPVRFQVGECYRKLAAQLQPSELRNDTWEAQRRNNLDWAAREFERVESEMLEFEKNGGQLTADQLALRDSLDFRIAGARFERAEFAQALPRYLALARTRAGTLDGLIALEGVARCHQFENRSQELQETLRHIRATLKELPPTVFTGQSPREFRRYWEVELPEQLKGGRP